MPPDTATSQSEAPAASVRSNAAVIAAIVAHHQQLAERLAYLTNALQEHAAKNEFRVERDELHKWYTSELLPHVAAEEGALYSRASALPQTRLLVDGMLAEHRLLTELIERLAEVETSLDAATTAAAAHAVFAVHLSKENDLLIPALDAAGTDLGAVLDGMHEILGHAAATSEHDAGGCGCSDSSAGDSQTTTVQPVAIQIGSRPPVPSAAPVAPSVELGPDGLDVRTLPHGARHEIIFSKLGELEHGEALTIINDHDPKPLRYQTSAMWPDRYEWTYLETGPTIWRVAITRVG